MLFIFGAVLGLVIGIIVAKIHTYFAVYGYLRVDKSEEEPYIFLELIRTPETLPDEKYIVLKVKQKDYIPHE